MTESRDYAKKLEELENLFQQNRFEFLNSESWGQVFNLSGNFHDLKDHSLYLRYANAVLSRILDYCKRASNSNAKSIALNFLQGAQFRFTAHTDESINELMQARARLFDFLLDELDIERDFEFYRKVSGGGRLRFGVILKHFGDDPEMSSVLPFFADLKKHGIDVTVFYISDLGSNDRKKQIQGISNRLIPLSENLSDDVFTIRAQDLDILLFANDITAKLSLPAYLSFFRLARKSMICVSTLCTTCSPYIDYYLGGSWYQSMGFDQEFSEQYLPVPNPGFAFDIGENFKQGSSSLTKADLGVDENSTLFISGANLTKLHNGLLSIWADILRRNPDSHLLLYPYPAHFGGEKEEINIRLKAFFSSHSISTERVLIVSTIESRDTLLNVLKLADVGLDSFPYTGVTTICDAIEAGLPTVTLQGQTLRSAQAAALFHSCGTTELISNSHEEYVVLASDLAADKAKREGIRSQLINSKKPFLHADTFSSAMPEIFAGIYKSLKDLEN